MLSIKDLQIQFRSNGQINTAVHSISLELEKGQTIGIVGESGSGKSVTTLATMGLLPKDVTIIPKGEIIFQSEAFGEINLLEASDDQLEKMRGKEIAMIFQEPMTSLNPVYTCGNQVSEAIRLHQKLSKEEAKKATISLFEEVELPRPEKIFDSYPHQISGGQKQRVMIAMAMSCKPQLLIADEPTTALDVTVQAGIIELMKKMQTNHGTSIIFITHDLGLISQVADDIIVMYKGNVMEQGNIQDIFNHPKHPYTKGLLACKPTLDTNQKILPTVNDFMEVNESCTIIEKEYIASTNYNTKLSFDKEATPILEINNLTTRFPLKKNFWGKPTENLDAVNDVSFNVYAGETIGLVGESGCGKSTLGKTITRLEKAFSGEILYNGKDILKLSPSEFNKIRPEIQIIFQDPYSSLNPRMTIGKAIMEPMEINGILKNAKERKAKTIELLETVGLTAEHFNRYPHEFSGGQRQRIGVARTLGLNPKVVICDESVSALDVSVQAQVLNLLNELKEIYGFTYIFISHDLSVVKFMADRLLVMNKGQIIESGYSEEIYKNPKNEYTKNLINAIPKIDVGIEFKEQN